MKLLKQMRDEWKRMGTRVNVWMVAVASCIRLRNVDTLDKVIDEARRNKELMEDRRFSAKSTLPPEGGGEGPKRSDFAIGTK